jgi:hypothetical protein
MYFTAGGIGRGVDTPRPRHPSPDAGSYMAARWQSVISNQGPGRKESHPTNRSTQILPSRAAPLNHRPQHRQMTPTTDGGRRAQLVREPRQHLRRRRLTRTALGLSQDPRQRQRDLRQAVGVAGSSMLSVIAALESVVLQRVCMGSPTMVTGRGWSNLGREEAMRSRGPLEGRSLGSSGWSSAEICLPCRPPSGFAGITCVARLPNPTRHRLEHLR